MPADPVCLSVSFPLHPTEECELGPWGSWSPCTYHGKTCGSAWGLETRVREASRAGQEEAAACQVLSESRKCSIQRPCPGGEHQLGTRGCSRQGPWVTLSGLRMLPPLIVPVRLPASPPFAIPSCGVSFALPAVLSKEGLLCWGQYQIHSED